MFANADVTGVYHHHDRTQGKTLKGFKNIMRHWKNWHRTCTYILRTLPYFN
jgi:hypothetical protein